ncbi:MAG: hypothetical protein A2Y25_02050 [Candidatus Melainabacteria bacterium GWF2_37_15]|nr:MAG: hypothetical protein A2Y25_02050 [Candidatus Melainabacteria bacterium GWF2_37_15]
MLKKPIILTIIIFGISSVLQLIDVSLKVLGNIDLPSLSFIGTVLSIIFVSWLHTRKYNEPIPKNVSFKTALYCTILSFIFLPYLGLLFLLFSLLVNFAFIYWGLNKASNFMLNLQTQSKNNPNINGLDPDEKIIYQAKKYSKESIIIDVITICLSLFIIFLMAPVLWHMGRDGQLLIVGGILFIIWTQIDRYFVSNFLVTNKRIIFKRLHYFGNNKSILLDEIEEIKSNKGWFNTGILTVFSKNEFSLSSTILAKSDELKENIIKYLEEQKNIQIKISDEKGSSLGSSIFANFIIIVVLLAIIINFPRLLYDRYALPGDKAYESGNLIKAEKLYKKALNIAEWNEMEDIKIANDYGNLGTIYRKQGKYKEAEELYKKSLVMARNFYGRDDTDIAYILENLGILYLSEGKYKKAEEILNKSISIYSKILGEDDYYTVRVHMLLAGTYNAQERYKEAEILYKDCISKFRKILGNNDPTVARVLSLLGTNYFNQNKFKEAENTANETLSIFNGKFDKYTQDIMKIYSLMGNIRQEQKKYKEAEQFYKKALEIGISNKLLDNTETLALYEDFGDLYVAQKRYKEAEDYFKKCLTLFKNTIGLDNDASKTISKKFQEVQKINRGEK